jgi:hypothetical protein
MNQEQIETTLRALEGYEDSLHDLLRVATDDEAPGIRTEIIITNEVQAILSARLLDYKQGE